MRETDYGKKMGQALRAVAKMHSQVSQLLSDCDSLFPDYESVFGNTATGDLTYHVRAKYWMAEGVFRYWFQQGQPVPGITAIFYREDQEQPLLLVGRIDYSGIDSQNLKEKCSPWDLWWALTDWAEQPPAIGQAFDLPEPDAKGTILSMKVITVPLFHVENLTDVKELFGKVGVHL